MTRCTPSFPAAWLGVLLALSSATPQAAEITPVARQEVVRLLDRLAASGCAFQRNGDWHDAAAARAHLAKKYQYLLDKGLVRTSEDFIARAGSKSSLSGDPYQVRCGNAAPLPSAQWLTRELQAIRAGTAGDKPPPSR